MSTTVKQLQTMDTSSVSSVTADFRSGTDASLKSISATTAKATDSLTAFRSTVTNTINATLSSLTNNTLSISDLNDFITFEDGHIGFNENELNSRIYKATGINISSTDAMSQSFKNMLYDDLNVATNGLAGKVVDRNGNVILIDTLETNSEYGNLVKVTDEYLSSQGDDRDEYYDRTTTTVTAQSLIQQDALGGNYQDVQDIYDTSDSTMQPELQDALIEVLPQVGANGDFRTSATITGICGTARCQAAVPNFINILFQNYRIPKYLTADEYTGESDRIIAFNDAYSPGWWMDTYNGQTADNLLPWMGASNGIYQLFQHSKDWAPLAAQGRLYVQEPTMTSLKKRWPDLATVELSGSLTNY